MKKKARRDVPVDRHRLTFKTLRLIRGLTPTEVAAKSGVAYQTIVNMRRPVSEGGTLAPRISVVDKICRAYGMKLDVVEMHENQGASKHTTREDRVSAASFN